MCVVISVIRRIIVAPLTIGAMESLKVLYEKFAVNVCNSSHDLTMENM